VEKPGDDPAVVGQLAARAAAIHRDRPAARGGAWPRLDACETRARMLAEAGGASEEIRRAAAVEFLGDAVTALALDGVWERGVARRAVVASAAALDTTPGAALLAVYLRALASPDAAQLPPHVATDLFLWLLVELGPADAASLWAVGASRRMEALGAAGTAPRSRRFRAAAAALLAGRTGGSPHVHAVTVERWDRPFAALVARASAGGCARLGVWLREAANALSPVLERETLFQRNAERERELVSAEERRLVRLGDDLHDGPLQEIVALADDLRLVRRQVASLLEPEGQRLVAGRFDDLDARLAALDDELRELARSVRPSAAVELPLEHVLRREVETFARATSIPVTLETRGELTDLTDSQKIVLYRVVQESLANVRKHSGATRAEVLLRAVAGFVEVTIADNGCGFDLHATVRRALGSDRLGLSGLSERVRLLGGSMEFEARVGEGVVVRATLPRWRPVVQAGALTYAAATA